MATNRIGNVEIITTQVAQKKQETYGYTAEQLLERLRGGASALPLVAYMISDTPKTEIERLLVHVLPDAYFHALNDVESSYEQDRHLILCYRKIFDVTDDDVKTKVMKNLYKVYKTRSEAEVLVYEDSFFRGSDLAYLSETERRFIKAHFLPRVSVETLNERLYNIVGIGPFIETEEAPDLAATLILAAQGDDKELAKRARTRLLNEYSKMAAECRTVVRDVADSSGATEILEKIEAREAKIKPPT